MRGAQDQYCVSFRARQAFARCHAYPGQLQPRRSFMQGNLAVAAVIVATVAVSLTQSTRAQTKAGLDTAAIEQGTGLKGQLIAEESVFKVTKPRTDVKIQVDQWTMPPFMGLSSWAAFTPAHIDEQVAMMGDTVVFEDEGNGVM